MTASLAPIVSTSTWMYPALEVTHIVGIGMLLGNLLLFELRVWGRHAALPIEALARAALPLAAGGFLLAGLSGVVMFATQPAELLANRAFVVKMLLLTLAGSNAAIFHSRGSLDKLDAFARWQTALSLGLWLAVIICGRWIAYV